MNFMKKVLRQLRNKPPKKEKNKHSTKCETNITEKNECDSQNDYEEDIIDPQECVDDLELGEEAWTFNLRQQIASMANYSTPQHMGSFYHQPTPSLSFFEKQGLPPLAPLIINNQPNVPGMPSMALTPSFMGSVPPSPCSFNFSTQAAATPGYYPYANNPYMNYSPHSGPWHAYATGGNYMGLSHMESLELHHLLGNGISETEALQTIQNKRLLEAAHRASAVSAVPPAHTAGVSTYPGPVDGYISADQSCNNHTDVTSEEAYSLAMQQYQADREKMVVGKTSSPMSRQPSAMLPKAHEKASCHLNEALEKANEDALQAGIAMSMKDANLSRSMRHQSPSMVQNRSNRVSNPPMSASGLSNDHHSPRLVSYSGSKSSDLSSPSAHMGYNQHAPGGIAPEYCGHNQVATSHAKSPRTVTSPYGQEHSERIIAQSSNCQPPNAAKMILARNQYPTQHHSVPNKSANGDDSKHSSPRYASSAMVNNR